MADTLSTIRARVAFKCGGVDNRDTYVDEAINEAILQVIQEGKPHEMETTTTWSSSTGTSSYSFSTIGCTDCYIPLFVRDNTNDYELKHRSYEEWNRYSHSTSSSSLGNPHLWTRFGNNIILWSRIPDSTSRTLQLTYLKFPTALSTDASTFPLNDEWQRPVDELAAGLLLRDLNSPKAAEKFQIYQELLARRMNIMGEENTSPEGLAFIPVNNLNMTS